MTLIVSRRDYLIVDRISSSHNFENLTERTKIVKSSDDDQLIFHSWAGSYGPSDKMMAGPMRKTLSKFTVPGPEKARAFADDFTTLYTWGVDSVGEQVCEFRNHNLVPTGPDGALQPFPMVEDAATSLSGDLCMNFLHAIEALKLLNYHSRPPIHVVGSSQRGVRALVDILPGRFFTSEACFSKDGSSFFREVEAALAATARRAREADLPCSVDMLINKRDNVSGVITFVNVSLKGTDDSKVVRFESVERYDYSKLLPSEKSSGE